MTRTDFLASESVTLEITCHGGIDLLYVDGVPAVLWDGDELGVCFPADGEGRAAPTLGGEGWAEIIDGKWVLTPAGDRDPTAETPIPEGIFWHSPDSLV